MPEKRITLASASPRRAEYLSKLGYRFEQFPPEIDERQSPGESPRRYVRRISQEKAETVALKRPSHWVVAADTTVVLDDAILGKPKSPRDARRMLRALSGRSHRVLSAITLMNARAAKMKARVSSTRVIFRELSGKEIGWYVDSKEPLDKAGAYGIQGLAGLFVKRIEGSFSNVVGFPLEAFHALAKDLGLPLPWEL